MYGFKYRARADRVSRRKDLTLEMMADEDSYHRRMAQLHRHHGRDAMAEESLQAARMACRWIEWEESGQ